MADQPVIPDNIHLMLGEMRGQLREVVHSMNNTSSKIDALTREVVEIKGIAVAVAAIDARLKVVETKVDSLETDRSRLDGALSLANMLRIWVPVLLGVITIVIVVLRANGKI